MKRIFIALLFFVFGVSLCSDTAWAGSCDPITITEGDSVAVTIKGSGSAPNNFRLCSGGPYDIATISPQSVNSDSSEAAFTITGLSRGTTVFCIQWVCPNCEIELQGGGTCNLVVTVLEPGAQSAPSPSGSQGSVPGSTQVAGEGTSSGSTSTPTEPKAPERPRKNVFIDVIPKPPDYGEPGGGSGEGEQPKTPPPSEPMVSRGLMVHIRSGPKKHEEIVDGTITINESDEDCCKKAEAALVRCYTTESNAFYYQCMEGGMAGATTIDNYTGLGEVCDAVCSQKQLEFQVQCMVKCRGKCNRRCACSSLNEQINREVIRLRYGQGGGGLGEDAISPGRMPR